MRNTVAGFWLLVDKTDGCWNFQGYVSPHGYGRYALAGQRWAHRVSWLLSGRVLLPGFVLDHICENRRCVNPEHLQQITQYENTHNHGASNALKLTCPHGHSYAQFGRVRALGGRYGIQRICTECDRIRAAQRREKARTA